MSAEEVTRNRKEEHVDICRDEAVQARRRYWDDVALVHSALPELDVADIDLRLALFGKKLEAPIIIAAMTGGYPGAREINRSLAKAAAECGVGLGVGSQRAALEDPALEGTFSVVREHRPPLVIGNVGAPQLIRQRGRRPLQAADLERARKMVGADVVAVHLNFLQEVAEWDGDTQARGCLAAIDALSRRLPLIVKETGAGIGREVARRLLRTSIKGVDVGGAGGTSFAAVEVFRARRKRHALAERLGGTFWDWGIPAPVSVIEMRQLHRTFPVIATGGIRNGLDVARALALGATAAGIAQPLLGPAMEGPKAVVEELEMIKAELRAAMFLTGSEDVAALSRAKYVLSGESARWLERA
ncbi:MAG: type 2 isopentenyl-diphosphate Delta-isomerase [Euryarchaeota archaeon]|nr:type 2 isopentenyl-diphosphate Delta-isomerase [Euryarchaeota archaeon]